MQSKAHSGQTAAAVKTAVQRAVTGHGSVAAAPQPPRAGAAAAGFSRGNESGSGSGSDGVPGFLVNASTTPGGVASARRRLLDPGVDHAQVRVRTWPWSGSSSGSRQGQVRVESPVTNEVAAYCPELLPGTILLFSLPATKGPQPGMHTEKCLPIARVSTAKFAEAHPVSQAPIGQSFTRLPCRTAKAPQRRKSLGQQRPQMTSSST